jgi:opacity protein-like surface antigen
LYPLVGLGLLNTSVDYGLDFGGLLGDIYEDNNSYSDFGINIGGGIDYKLNSKMFLNAELKYKIAGDWNRLLLSAGFSYKF